MNFFEKYKWLAPMQLFIGALLAARVMRTQPLYSLSSHGTCVLR